MKNTQRTSDKTSIHYVKGVSGYGYDAPNESTKQHNTAGQKQEVYQVSTMTSLLEAVYDGDFSLSHIPEHGDFGIGTFNQLDGELIGFDGAFIDCALMEQPHQ